MLLDLVLLPCIANRSGGKPHRINEFEHFPPKKAKADFKKVLSRYHAASSGFTLPEVSLCLKKVPNFNEDLFSLSFSLSYSMCGPFWVLGAAPQFCGIPLLLFPLFSFLFRSFLFRSFLSFSCPFFSRLGIRCLLLFLLPGFKPLFFPVFVNRHVDGFPGYYRALKFSGWETSEGFGHFLVCQVPGFFQRLSFDQFR